ncbi:glycosyltransferase [Podospora conica]|nr:glycosyltransferase [Schizothecium conicum]
MKLSSDFAALCAVTSFLWLAHNLEEHQITQQPQLGSVLILFISAIAAFAASFVSPWLAGPGGRYDEESGPLKVTRANLPTKPRRYVLPLLVGSIIIRIVLFHSVSKKLQCTNTGVELWLPFLLLVCELLSRRGPRSSSGHRNQDDDDDDDDGMGNTIFEALGAWLTGSKTPLVLGMLLLTIGAHLVSSQNLRSTAFCPGRDLGPLIVSYQWIGLVLDVAIVHNAWRVLAWARTTQLRLKTLGSILISAAMGTGLLYTLVFPHGSQGRSNSPDFDSLYAFDVIVDGLIFSTFFVSAALLATQESAVSLVGLLFFASSLSATIHRGLLIGSWENVSPFTTYAALILLATGFVFFVYAKNLRSVVYLPRTLVVFCLVVLSIAATIFTIIKTRKAVDTHPITRLVYDARVAEDRWLRHASVSNSLRVAVSEYKNRHHGRDPPPKFDMWYQFARDRKSPIIDHFAQMEGDILPFWGMTPERIRKGLERVAAEPDVAVVTIQDGKLFHKVSSPPEHKAMMDELAELVSGFAGHLPYPLEFAVNLNDRPRVLAPWEDMKRFTQAGKQAKVTNRNILPRDSLSSQDSSPDSPKAPPAPTSAVHRTGQSYREMMALTCPPGSKMRSRVYWDIQGFCSACASPQSQGQFLTRWHRSLQLCHQPDLLRLHGFHITPPNLPPIQELVPIFSQSKTGRFGDILLPLRHAQGKDSPNQDRDFDMKPKQLYWRSPLDPDLFRPSHYDHLFGGHQERLAHLANNASRRDTTTILLPRSNKLAYERVPTADLNNLMPMDAGFEAYSDPCRDDIGCHTVHREFAVKPLPPGNMSPAAEALAHQFILLTDTNDGPPKDLVSVMRSNSVPFLSTIFREWYTERLIPWVHFVPIDVRFHALHSTLSYFSGLNGRAGARLNGREVNAEAHVDDARWIADEGKLFAARALRREDMEVYLFRLLLEWGRVSHEDREHLGFSLSEEPST